jgi:hypothetical protein
MLGRLLDKFAAVAYTNDRYPYSRGASRGSDEEVSPLLCCQCFRLEALDYCGSADLYVVYDELGYESSQYIAEVMEASILTPCAQANYRQRSDQSNDP